MKLTKEMTFILIGICLLSLTGCHHKRPQNTTTYDTNDYLTHRSAQTSGLGEESRFGGETAFGSAGQLASRHVYYFDFDSNVVHARDRFAILATAKYLLSHPNVKVLLEGHTDPRGSREYNIGLGERRAKAVAEILMSQGGNASQIRTVSYGAEKLASPGRSESDFQLDRRVVLVKLRR